MDCAEMKYRVKIAADVVGIKLPHRLFDSLEQSIEAFNPKYPTDFVSLKDAAILIFRNKTFPNERERDILLKALRKADFGHGDESWQLDHNGHLSYRFTPKRSGAHYWIEFGNLRLPLHVKAHRFADMDNMVYHDDLCPMLLSEDDPQWSDDCDCQAPVEIFRTKFASRDEYDNKDSGIVGFLDMVHWGEHPGCDGDGEDDE